MEKMIEKLASEIPWDKPVQTLHDLVPVTEATLEESFEGFHMVWKSLITAGISEAWSKTFLFQKFTCEYTHKLRQVHLNLHNTLTSGRIKLPLAW